MTSTVGETGTPQQPHDPNRDAPDQEGSAQPRHELSLVERKRRWREVALLYSFVTALTLSAGWLDGLWAPLAGISALIVALGFMLTPTELIQRRGERVTDFGIGGRADQVPETLVARSLRATREALKVSLIVLPLYVLGSWAWHSVQGESGELSLKTLSRWDESTRGLSARRLPLRAASIETRGDILRLRWRAHPDRASARAARVSAPLTFKIKLGQGVTDLETDSLTISARSRGVKLRELERGVFELEGPARGYISLKTTARTLTISPARQTRARLTRWFGGEYATPLQIEGGTFQSARSLSWLWSVFLIQIFLVGLPEEVFYRGYLQTRLDSLVGRDQIWFGVRFNLKSALLCSALFAFAHLVTIPHPSRLAVFFPSVLFGWMRRAYHDTLTPAIFHAMCNVIAQLIWGCYALN